MMSERPVVMGHDYKTMRLIRRLVGRRGGGKGALLSGETLLCIAGYGVSARGGIGRLATSQRCTKREAKRCSKGIGLAPA